MRTVEMKLLPDGSGRVRIHFFVHTPDGPVHTPEGTLVSKEAGVPRPIKAGGSVGRIACQPKLNSILPQPSGGKTATGSPVLIKVMCHSNDARGITCPECMDTQDYKDMMKLLGELVDNSATSTIQGV